MNNDNPRFIRDFEFSVTSSYNLPDDLQVLTIQGTEHISLVNDNAQPPLPVWQPLPGETMDNHVWRWRRELTPSEPRGLGY